MLSLIFLFRKIGANLTQTLRIDDILSVIITNEAKQSRFLLWASTPSLGGRGELNPPLRGFQSPSLKKGELLPRRERKFV